MAVRLTDNKGAPVPGLPTRNRCPVEPAKGSVVMVDGMRGVAWQRHHFDGLWHSPKAAPRKWETLCKQRRNIFLLLEAKEV